MTWDPTLYLTFAAPRLRPAVGLLARVELTDPTRVVDHGSGAAPRGALNRVTAVVWNGTATLPSR